MQNTLLLLFFYLYPLVLFAQVGINTNTPLSTLDVNGDVRVQNVASDTLSHNVLMLGENNIISTNTIENLMIDGSNLKSFVKGTIESSLPITDTFITNGWYKLALPTINFDENKDDYNSTTSEFTAPSDGIYNIYIQLKVIGGDITSGTEVGVGIFKNSNGINSLLCEQTYYDANINMGSSYIQASPPTRNTQTLVKLIKGEHILFGVKTPSTNLIFDQDYSCYFTINQIK